MLRGLLPNAYRIYEQSHLAGEFHEFAAWLRATGYSDYRLCRHLCRLRKALEAGKAIAGQRWQAEKLSELFERYCKSAFNYQSVDYNASRRLYERYLDAQGRLHKSKPPNLPFGRLREEYRRYLADVCGFCIVTTSQHLATTSEFLANSAKAGGSPAHLTFAHIESYLSEKSRTCNRQSLQNVVSRLRAFLRYAFTHGMIRERLDTIDTPRSYRGELPPRALPWTLVKRLLSSIDRSCRTGWRDYMMLHLMAYYGLRASEIADLRIDSIDWTAKTCRVVQRKTRSDLILPLSDQTLSLLRRYLSHRRPTATCPQLFLRARDPAGRIKHTAVCDVFCKSARESGLLKQHYSSYSLRHAFAMRLLERGVGVKAIGDCLGHRSLEATCVYLRLNLAALRTVGLPLPLIPYRRPQ